MLTVPLSSWAGRPNGSVRWTWRVHEVIHTHVESAGKLVRLPSSVAGGRAVKAASGEGAPSGYIGWPTCRTHCKVFRRREIPLISPPRPPADKANPLGKCVEPSSSSFDLAFCEVVRRLVDAQLRFQPHRRAHLGRMDVCGPGELPPKALVLPSVEHQPTNAAKCAPQLVRDRAHRSSERDMRRSSAPHRFRSVVVCGRRGRCRPALTAVGCPLGHSQNDSLL